MGQFGFSKIEIAFKSDKTPVGFKSKDEILKEIDNDLNVYDFNEEGGGHVTFEISSGRLENLEYQVKTILEYIRDNKIELEFFSSSSYAESDYGSYQFEDNETLEEIL